MATIFRSSARSATVQSPYEDVETDDGFLYA
jgi:hypothetical protein